MVLEYVILDVIQYQLFFVVYVNVVFYKFVLVFLLMNSECEVSRDFDYCIVRIVIKIYLLEDYNLNCDFFFCVSDVFVFIFCVIRYFFNYFECSLLIDYN